MSVTAGVPSPEFPFAIVGLVEPLVAQLPLPRLLPCWLFAETAGVDWSDPLGGLIVCSESNGGTDPPLNLTLDLLNNLVNLSVFEVLVLSVDMMSFIESNKGDFRKEEFKQEAQSKI